jgi:hypothetical protein
VAPPKAIGFGVWRCVRLAKQLAMEVCIYVIRLMSHVGEAEGCSIGEWFLVEVYIFTRAAFGVGEGERG